ncbi:MAG TPA: hypothetical protein VHP33_19395 [Polyangiaceae bacterium]|nr:hypothetical protein [Polyangiaceae bacterium]
MRRFPRKQFCAASPEHESELQAPPEERTVVTMLEALELNGTERVLEIGSTTAYTAALLSQLSAEVYSVVAEQDAAERRGRHLHALGCRNAHVVLGAPHTGWPSAAPYQAILVGASAAQVPLELIDQLELGGCLVIPIGDEQAQLLERVYKRRGALSSETLGACHVAMLADGPRERSLVPWVHQPRG